MDLFIAAGKLLLEFKPGKSCFEGINLLTALAAEVHFLPLDGVEGVVVGLGDVDLDPFQDIDGFFKSRKVNGDKILGDNPGYRSYRILHDIPSPERTFELLAFICIAPVKP